MTLPARNNNNQLDPQRNDGSQPVSNDELLRIASSLARFGGWSVDLANGQILWSDEVAAIHDMPPGYSPALQQGINFYAPECRARISEVFAACASEGKPYDEELQIITARDRRVWVRAVGRAIRNPSGTITHVVGAFQDITERKQAQLALAESERRYRALFEHMTAGFVLFSVVLDDAGAPVDLVIEAANKQFETAVRMDSAGFLGKRLTEALPGIQNDSADWIGRYSAVAMTGESVTLEKTSDLLGVHYLVSAYQSGPMRCAVTFIDVTERKRAESAVRELHEELRQHAAQLEQRVAERTAELDSARVRAEAADRAKSAFLATMSHELRTPLNAIIGFTDVMLARISGPLTDEQDKQLRIVQQSSQNLLSLITDVLDVAKIEAGQLRLELERFDLRGIIEHGAAVFGPEAHRRGLQFAVDLGALSAPVVADRRRVEQVLNNLLANAVKFTAAGTVSVSLRADDAELTVTVSDTGIGIRTDDLPRLFQPFSQMESSRLTSREGTGLGLAISKHLIDAMNGRIWVESTWGSGSRFHFALPAAGSRD